ncbi:MAG: helix-turn-helix transcriptional regulator [Acidobacteriaceae bacterium]|nr:helix-turn-helix transcriptional regulator [Acidobacteriaceae bacterium]
MSITALAKLSHTAAIILQTIDQGGRYGFDIMDQTGLPSGTVYPALRRMEAEGLISSHWESEKKAIAEQRPPRKYYRITRSGSQVLEYSQRRYPLLARLLTKPHNRATNEANRRSDEDSDS